jgi:hypothetical protein
MSVTDGSRVTVPANRPVAGFALGWGGFGGGGNGAAAASNPYGNCDAMKRSSAGPLSKLEITA